MPAVGLLDIFQKSEKVPVNDEQSLDIIGWSGRAIAMLINRFPDMLSIMTGKVDKNNYRDIGGDALAAAIAYATPGGIENPEAEKVADRLGFELQYELIQAAIRVTFPGGIGPFVEKIFVLQNEIMAQASAVNSTNLPKQSSPSKETDTQPSGT